jgi:hypothetical protein
MKFVKVMKGMKKSTDRLGAMTSHEESASAETRVLTEVVIGLSFRHSPTPRVAAAAARRASPPRDVMAPLRAQVIFMLFTAFMTFMSFLEICLENH